MHAAQTRANPAFRAREATTIHARSYPHTIRYTNALLLHWSRHMQPLGKDGKTIGYQAGAYLTTLLSWADGQFLMGSLHRGEPLSLSNSDQHELCGHSPRQCLRLRGVLERYGLIRVQPGSFNGGDMVSAEFTILFDNILAPVSSEAAETAAETRPALRSSSEPWTVSLRDYLNPRFRS